MFVILSEARSGSTTMLGLMNPKSRVLQEPLGRMNLDRKARLSDFYEIENIFGPYEGVKLMAHRLHLKDFGEWASKEKAKVIVMFRRNFLRMAVSVMLARRTQVWSKQFVTEGYYSMQFDPVPLEEIQTAMERCQKNTKGMRSLARMGNCFQVYYEDFYLQRGWEKTLPQIYKFCGFDPTIKPRSRKLAETYRINNNDVYLNIANVHEIEKEFGSNETGWLLDSSFTTC